MQIEQCTSILALVNLKLQQKLDPSENISEVSGKFINLMLGKDGNDQLADRVKN
jgi:hypothetical protein